MKDFRGDDDAQLAAMGHKAELNRNFSMLYVASPMMLLLLIYLSRGPLLTDGCG